MWTQWKKLTNHKWCDNGFILTSKHYVEDNKWI